MIVIVGAKWCAPCGVAKDQIGQIAYQMGINLGIEDLGDKNNFNENKGRLEDRGYIFTKKGIPAFFKNRKQIDGPKSYRKEHIMEWLESHN